MIFVFFLGYTLITSSGSCHHRNGAVALTSCTGISPVVDSRRRCEDYCSSTASCVGYTYGTTSNFCMMYVPRNDCPNGFNFKRETYYAQTMQDLVRYSGSGSNGYVCYGKNHGKIDS